MKLNIGCGTDYRDGFVNIDGSDQLLKVDQVIDFSQKRLTQFFAISSVEHIVASDFLEHQFHWEACRFLRDCHWILQDDGILELRTPDIEFILNSTDLTIDQKLLSIYGSQDIPFGSDEVMNKSRASFPQFFCHKYCWKKEALKSELINVGFRDIEIKDEQKNFVIVARK